VSSATFFRHLWRESRGARGKLVFFVACLAIGVAAVVAVAGFCEGLERGVRGEARALLAADLAVRGQRPVPDALKQAVDAMPGARRTDVLEMLTLVAKPQTAGAPAAAVRSQLVELKSVDGEYPFYGELELEPPRPIAELLDAESAVVAPELLARLRVPPGGEIRIGGESFRVSGTVLAEPDRIAGAFNMGPRVFLSAAGLDRAGLEKYGSRIRYRTLIALPPARAEEAEKLADELAVHLDADRRHRIETSSDAQPALRRGLRRMERFLGLAALLSLLIGGVGVAQTVRAWLAGRMDAIAVLKCLGYRPREILWLYLGQAAALGLAASVLGIGLGLGVEAVAVRVLSGVLPVEHLDLWQPGAILRGVVLGVGVGVLFSLPPLMSARRVPPVRVLRRDAEALPPSRWTVGLMALALFSGIFALAVWQSGSLDLGARFAGGVVAVTAVLAAAAYGLTRLAARPRRFTRLWLRQGFAALARPGASTVSATVALGLGVLVILTMVLVERRLSAQFDEEVPADAPSAFLIDIQPDQWPGVQRLLESEGALAVQSAPVVMARFTSIDGKPIEELVGRRRERSSEGRGEEEERNERDRRREGSEPWALRREQRLAYFDELPDDNVVVAGELWSKPGVDEVSVEEEYAESIGVGLGSKILLDIQGVPLELEVTSIRTVDWSSFGINFYMVVEPGVLDEAPQYRIAAVRLPEGAEQTLQDGLAYDFPNVTVIRLRDVLERITGILRQLGLGVRLLGGLTVLAGLAILAGAVSAGSLRRGAEVALLKTLGMTRRQVAAGFAAEYALIGLIAGVIGSAGAGVLSWLVTTRGMELGWTFEPLGHLGAVAGTVLLAVFAGLASSTWALQRRPVEALRAADG
jgi:putative ABC transport system permease protein